MLQHMGTRVGRTRVPTPGRALQALKEARITDQVGISGAAGAVEPLACAVGLADKVTGKQDCIDNTHCIGHLLHVGRAHGVILVV